MKSILIPTDFSDNAWSALSYALKLYEHEECTFYFLNSFFFYSSGTRLSMTSHLNDTLRESSKRDLNELKAKTETKFSNPKHTFEIISSADKLPIAITNHIRKYTIDMVIMGTKGATGLDKFFFGSNTIKTIQNIKECPVLAVPKTKDFMAPKQIAFPTDFSRAFDHETLKPLLDFAEQHNAHINVLHINVDEKLSDTQNINILTLKEYLVENKHSFHWMPAYTKKSEVITDFIKDLNIDILAMFNYKHSIIEKITKEPIIKNIGYQPTIPFLIIPSE